MIVVPAEMLGVDSGLGYAVLNTRDRLAYPELMAMILIIGAYGYLMDLGVRWVVSEPWRKREGMRATGTSAPSLALVQPTPYAVHDPRGVASRVGGVIARRLHRQTSASQYRGL